MARRLRIEYEGAIYHVTFRGNGRQRIFKDDRDRRRMLDGLEQRGEDFEVNLFAYCLMDNHVHLLLETPRANLSRFMGSLLTGYAVYFNRRHRRVGHLMQGRFGAKLVDVDEYLLGVSRYIHLNPVRVAERKKEPLPEQRRYLRSYGWSSYRAYAGLGVGEPWLQCGPVSRLAPGRGAKALRYRRYVEEQLGESDIEWKATMRASPFAIGSEAFRETARHKYDELVGQSSHAEDVALRRTKHMQAPEAVLTEVCRHLNIKRGELDRKRRDSWRRAVAATMLVRFAGLTQREVADLLRIRSGAAVSYLLRRIRERAERESWLDRIITALERDLGSTGQQLF